ncbi:MAG: peptide chain release factor 2 [Candidatus Omnitrophica bacterium]|nr:peptide chain release factor 2 [Candidatus Omnitrophota bacterium]MBU0896418.1 peptide chain release factor 2 [Candidatus Omnitrophota bacterium]MBU1133785.1 peptide chain release factor 2 [Candidatus Omnitrophota bacterium]MBU1810943.1 peptide chain release factor 2 [Candidatus Omnitrophota bacterium]
MEEINKKIDELNKGLTNLNELLRVEEKKKNLQELQLKMSQDNFWQDQKQAQKVVEELKNLKRDIGEFDVLNDKLEELKEFTSLSDTSMESDISREVKTLEINYEKLKVNTLFSQKFDSANTIVEINSGAGGTEACDWASMLFRMYFRWTEGKGFNLKVLREEKGEEAGVKSITFFVQGWRAYGLLKSETGVHRLVRVSPFDANKRRHTSFASVNILPEIKEDIEIEIKSEELRIDTFRSSGAGGQHVNVTDSAVRITHLPTGIVVGCQNERSQHQNKQSALKILKAKLYERKKRESKEELKKVSGQKQKIEWGSQIRSYILYPYLLVKDHRTGLEVHDAWAVLEGKIDDFIYAYLKTQVVIDGQKH